MTNEIKIFDYSNKMVRMININDESWWVLKDVCKILKISNPTMIANRLDNDEVTKLDLGGKVGITNIVNESGLYSVILRSDKPEAKPFRKWITSGVLPSIRKTGSYSVNPESNSFNNQVLNLLKTQQEQFANMFSLITTRLPQPYSPPYTRWIAKTYEKVDKLANNYNVTRKQMLHNLYSDLHDTYDLDLNDHQYEYCMSHNISNNGLYTMNIIGADPQLKQWFDLIVDTQLEQIVS